MWWTSVGERVLRGAEWNLFREGLSRLWDDVEISDDDDVERGTTGVAVFDGLRKAERLALMATVARGLSDVDEPCSGSDGLDRCDHRRGYCPDPLSDQSRGRERADGA